MGTPRATRLCSAHLYRGVGLSFVWACSALTPLQQGRNDAVMDDEQRPTRT